MAVDARVLRQLHHFLGSFKEHLNHIWIVWGLFSRAGVSLKVNKCFFLEDCIDYFGHVIQHGRLDISKKSTDVTLRLQHTMTLTALKSFFGLLNVFPRFVRNFAWIAAPLNWTRLKLRRSKHDTIDWFHPEIGITKTEWTLHASCRHLWQASWVFLTAGAPQRPGKARGVLVTFFNEAWTGIQSNSQMMSRCRMGCPTNELYLKESRFTIWMDYKALWLMPNMADMTGKSVRCRLQFPEFDFEVVCRTGVKHQAVGELSRFPTTRME